MAFKTKFKLDPIRSLAFGSIGTSYTAIGSAFTNPARIIIFNNLTDVSILFSFDGITDHLILPTNGFKVLDVTSNEVRDDGFFIAEGTVIYAKQESVAATLGNIYIEVIHA